MTAQIPLKTHLSHLVRGQDGLCDSAAASALSSFAATDIAVGQDTEDVNTFEHLCNKKHARASVHSLPTAAADVNTAILDVQRAGESRLLGHMGHMRSARRTTIDVTSE